MALAGLLLLELLVELSDGRGILLDAKLGKLVEDHCDFLFDLVCLLVAGAEPKRNVDLVLFQSPVRGLDLRKGLDGVRTLEDLRLREALDHDPVANEVVHKHLKGFHLKVRIPVKQQIEKHTDILLLVDCLVTLDRSDLSKKLQVICSAHSALYHRLLHRNPTAVGW